jgi:uncharacterized protein YukE
VTNVKNELDQALTQLRTLSGAMTRALAEFEAAGVWAGDDAATFQTQWAEQVQRNLTIATNALDTVSYVPAG